VCQTCSLNCSDQHYLHVGSYGTIATGEWVSSGAHAAMNKAINVVCVEGNKSTWLKQQENSNINRIWNLSVSIIKSSYHK